MDSGRGVVAGDWRWEHSIPSGKSLSSERGWVPHPLNAASGARLLHRRDRNFLRDNNLFFHFEGQVRFLGQVLASGVGHAFGPDVEAAGPALAIGPLGDFPHAPDAL